MSVRESNDYSSHWSRQDHQYMALALRLAEKGQYTARPNPMVGCVLVNKGEIIGQGWHKKFGENHAEIEALDQAKKNYPEAIKGATCYVTLEPCAHTGKTKPCVEALVNSGITKVIAAMQDPNPKVSGNGFEILRLSGIEVNHGLLQGQAKKLNKGFISRIEKNKPWVTLKLAMSLDGRTALADGSSKWITGCASRQDVQKTRARQDAIITGVGTVLADNPSLTVRASDQEWFDQLSCFTQPTRIILDRGGRSSLENKIFNHDAEVWWVSDATEYIKSAHKEHVKIVQDGPLDKLLTKCATNEMNNVLIEAGHRLAGQFLNNNLVDELIIYIAPKLMGSKAMGLFDLDVLEMDNCPELVLQDVRQFGDDIRLTYYPK